MRRARNSRALREVAEAERGIILKSPEEIAIMRRAGRVVALVLEELVAALSPGMATSELDARAEEVLASQGARASFKGYRGYPASMCISVNDEVVHGIPGARRLQEGDLVSLDVGAIVDGFHGDGAVTVALGQGGKERLRLVEVTREALRLAIARIRPGARLGDLSWAIQEFVEGQGLSVVREYVGHGIGREMHEEPPVPNFGPPGEGPLLLAGMTLALEPMVNLGDWRTRVAPNGWTVHTADGSPSAHFEHTIAISDGSAEVLTEL